MFCNFQMTRVGAIDFESSNYDTTYRDLGF
jgi:hypothetical protein